MGLRLVSSVALAALAGWLLYAVPGRVVGIRETTVGGQAARAAEPVFSPRDVQLRKERAALEAAPAQGAGGGATTTAPGTPLVRRTGRDRSLSIPAGPNGHFAVDARVNGKAVRFMIDTGATGIVLNREDAARIGLRPREQDFTGSAGTANGRVRYAPVVLRSLRAGGLSLEAVPATVIGGRLDVSLLGMSFLGRLKGYEVRNGSLVLYW